MSTHKNIDKICSLILALTLILTIVFINGSALGIKTANAAPAYQDKLFNTNKVHTINIVIDDWEFFLETCTNEEYVPCSVIINGEAFKNVALRAKGNTSLSSVRNYGNNRYSFKIEFDGYDSSKSYYGLDKLCLNNVIQDNTYMKDYIVYRMMAEFGASAPLVSYVALSVNGEYFGLYLAIEAVEDSFLQRNFGNNSGNLYKPDSMNMGGGKGNGRDFDFAKFESERSENANVPNRQFAENGARPRGARQKTEETTSSTNNKDNGSEFNSRQKTPGNPPNFGGGGFGGMGMGSSDVSLIYTDDEHSSYPNIFESAKTEITDSDKDRLIKSLKNINENTNLENSLDVEAVIRYFVVHNFAVNFDSYTGSMIHNYYLYEEDGKLSMLPWDYNLAFGGFQASSNATGIINYPIDTPVSGGNISSRPMIAWIFSNEEYTNQYHKLFNEFITNYFSNGKFETELNNAYNLISPYVENDPTKFCTFEEFEKGVSTLREFCLLRAKSIQGQLSGSIPSTSEDQTENSSALIEAGDLSISSMGSMGFGGMRNHKGGAMPGRENMRFQSPGNISENSENALPQEAQRTQNQNTSNHRSMPPDFNSDRFQGTQGNPFERASVNTDRPAQHQTPPNMENMQPPGMHFNNQSNSMGKSGFSFINNNTTLFIISCAVLLVGLFISAIYKR